MLVTVKAKDAREVIIGLAEALGMKAWHAGPISKPALAESMTSALKFMNKRNKFPGAGVKIITGEVE